MQLFGRVSRRVWVLGGGVGVIALVVALGPREHFVESWVEPSLPARADSVPAVLDAWLAERERGVPGLRSGDQRQIEWFDSLSKGRTPLALVYLHGFSADRHEIEPVVSEVARTLGANVYFARLSGHGRDGPAMAEATVESWLADAVEAVEIGGRLGDRVVVLGTSTGGTLATWVATRPESRGRVDALVLLSPNFHPRDRTSRVLLYPWGGQIAQVVTGKERCFAAENEQQQRHWTTCYPTASLRPMMALVERVRTMPLDAIAVPTLVLYSPRDEVVDPAETEAAVARMTGTVPDVRVVTSATDPAHHVLAGDIMSPESNVEARTAIVSFLRRVLGLDAVGDPGPGV